MKLNLNKETLRTLSFDDQSLVEGAAQGQPTTVVLKTYGPECLISSALPPTHRPDCAIPTNPR